MNRLLLSGAAMLLAGPALAQETAPMGGMDHSKMDHAAATTPAPADPHAGRDMASMPGMDMSAGAHAMTGAFGPYSATRESSGTAWQPDASTHDGAHLQKGPWSVMVHGVLNGVYDRQNGRRGDDMAFASGMLMGMAQRELAGENTLQLRAMVSPDPAMGKRGYPLLLAAGETADGKTPLVDRQHPHDLFMELSASLSHKLSAADSVFVYAGLPGEPAFGPPAFMHRASILDSPEAPITHHWLDSTHITFGVITVGYVHAGWKLEGSAFKGREPDEHRNDIETPRLDSTALRLSYNPTPNWSLQTSWARVKGPEQLEPDAIVTRRSASAIYTVSFRDIGSWSTTAAWGRRSADGEDLDAWMIESAVKPDFNWTIFARAERVETDELLSAGGHHGPVFTVAKASLGAIRDWDLGKHLSVGLGGLYAVNLVPGGLEPAYGSDPTGGMVFARLRIVR